MPSRGASRGIALGAVALLCVYACASPYDEAAEVPAQTPDAALQDASTADAPGSDTGPSQDAQDDGSDGSDAAAKPAPKSTPGLIACGMTSCTASTEHCCTGSTPTCTNVGQLCTFGSELSCDEAADCPGGSICCLAMGGSGGTVCRQACMGGEIQICATNGECAGTPCERRTCPATFSSFYSCKPIAGCE